MHFKDVKVKDPSEKFLVWVSQPQFRLPKSNYLNTRIRGKLLVELEIDDLEYIGWTCKQCNELTKKQAKYLYFINLYPKISELEIDEEMFDLIVSEDIGQEHIN